MSESIIFLALAMVWVGYLAIWWRDSRRVSTRRADRISSFSTQLGSLGRSRPRSVSAGSLADGLVPRSSIAAAQRRREVLIALGSLAVVTMLGALAFGAVFVLLHVVVDIGLAAYGYACVQRRNELAEREMKVTMLYPQGPAAQLAAPESTPLRRTVNA